MDNNLLMPWSSFDCLPPQMWLMNDEMIFECDRHRNVGLNASSFLPPPLLDRSTTHSLIRCGVLLHWPSVSSLVCSPSAKALQCILMWIMSPHILCLWVGDIVHHDLKCARLTFNLSSSYSYNMWVKFVKYQFPVNSQNVREPENWPSVQLSVWFRLGESMKISRLLSLVYATCTSLPYLHASQHWGSHFLLRRCSHF